MRVFPYTRTESVCPMVVENLALAPTRLRGSTPTRSVRGGSAGKCAVSRTLNATGEHEKHAMRFTSNPVVSQRPGH